MTLKNIKFNTIVLSIIGSILIFAFGIVLYVSTSALDASIEKSLEEATQPLVSATARLLFNPLYTLDISEMEEVLTSLSAAKNIIYAGVRDRNGKLIAAITDEWNPDGDKSIALAGKALSTQKIVQEISGNQSIIVSPIAVGSEQIGSVEFVFDLIEFRNELEALKSRIAITIILAFVGVFLAISILRRLILRPLNQLAMVAEQIGHGNLDVPIEPSGTQEMFLLGSTLEQMKFQLRESLGSLEQQVADRTRALETTNEVSRRLSTILDQEQLVREVVEQLRTGFGYYHVHIYLYDEFKQNLIMVGGTGDAGRTMLAREHKLAKGQGLVGQAAVSNQVVLIPDIRQAEDWLANPLLPETKAELAVPIAISDEVLGVLDVQHNVTGGLSEQDADLTQAIASQVAIAVQNAQAYTRSQRQAIREAQIMAISQRIQSAVDVDDVLKIAVSELGNTLGARSSKIDLRVNKLSPNERT